MLADCGTISHFIVVWFVFLQLSKCILKCTKMIISTIHSLYLECLKKYNLQRAVSLQAQIQKGEQLAAELSHQKVEGVFFFFFFFLG
ncbi:hypothetical protein TorRG33x02_178870 [Trema orientale]|uniref:Uncharacterized protein n=1 Tax=Trema orientale TaxID=63057 RepID=A0A2P5ELC4_TREOI|nr:hypothetical protein TorRG33x02_178870 [Trema orientale]